MLNLRPMRTVIQTLASNSDVKALVILLAITPGLVKTCSELDCYCEKVIPRLATDW